VLLSTIFSWTASPVCDAGTKKFTSCTTTNAAWKITTDTNLVVDTSILVTPSQTGTVTCTPMYQETAAAVTSGTIT